MIGEVGLGDQEGDSRSTLRCVVLSQFEKSDRDINTAISESGWLKHGLWM